jgi:hypothetical protein
VDKVGLQAKMVGLESITVGLDVVVSAVLATLLFD